MIRRYIFKLHPTAAQAAILHEQRKMMADLWNALKQRHEDVYRRERRALSYFDLTNEITNLRHECPEWENIPAITAHRVAKCPAEQSRVEIERQLKRYGADAFMYFEEAGRAAVAFRAQGRHVRFLLPMPNPTAREFTHTPQTDRPRSPESRMAAYDQAVRQRWRALALVIKAKLEAIEAGISVFDDEFLAHVVLPDGKTVGETIRPQIENAYRTGNMPPLLPHYGGQA